jgi:hypothetical protein
LEERRLGSDDEQLLSQRQVHHEVPRCISGHQAESPQEQEAPQNQSDTGETTTGPKSALQHGFLLLLELNIRIDLGVGDGIVHRVPMRQPLQGKGGVVFRHQEEDRPGDIGRTRIDR